MTQRQKEARLTRRFRERVAATGLTDAAAARAIGVSREYYRQVTHDETGPSMRFAIGAVHAGLADSIAEVAEPTAPVGDASPALAGPVREAA